MQPMNNKTLLDFISLNSDHPEKNWTEDFSHENGNYLNHCIICKDDFFGHKRRVLCKSCSEIKTDPK